MKSILMKQAIDRRKGQIGLRSGYVLLKVLKTLPIETEEEQ